MGMLPQCKVPLNSSCPVFIVSSEHANPWRCILSTICKMASQIGIVSDECSEVDNIISLQALLVGGRGEGMSSYE